MVSRAGLAFNPKLPPARCRLEALDRDRKTNDNEHRFIIAGLMPRPPKCRRVALSPGVTYFKPRGVPLSELEEVILAHDELEALRLADLEGLYQDDAAERMKISRPTFSRIIEKARRVVAEALVGGKALRVEGGNVMVRQRTFHCFACGHEWQVPFGTGRPHTCPSCQSDEIARVDAERGYRCRAGHGGGRGWGRGRGCRWHGGQAPAD